MHGFDGGNPGCGKATATQTFGIHRAGVRRLPFAGHKRRQVGKQQAAHGREAVRPQAQELAHHGEAAQDHPVIHMHMTCQLGVVGKNGVAADLAIVRQVHISHEQVVVADARDAATGDRARIEGTELADGIAIADDQLRGLTRVLLVLRGSAQRGVVVDGVVAANRGVAFDHAVRAHRGAFTDLHVRTDDAVRADRDRRMQLRSGFDQGAGMNQLAHGEPQAILRMVHIRSASTATSSPTRARALNLKMPAFMRSMVTSRISWSPGSTGRLKRAPSMPAK